MSKCVTCLGTRKVRKLNLGCWIDCPDCVPTPPEERRWKAVAGEVYSPEGDIVLTVHDWRRDGAPTGLAHEIADLLNAGEEARRDAGPGPLPPRRGDIWRDLDPRGGPRFVVDEVDEASGKVRVRNLDGKRSRSVQLRRFRPNDEYRSGYTLVSRQSNS